MKAYLARVFSMHPLAMIAGVCMVALTVPAYRLLDSERTNVGFLPKTVNTQAEGLQTQIKELRIDVFAEIAEWRKATDRQATALAGMIDRQATAAQGTIVTELARPALARVDVAMGIVEARSGQALETAAKLTATAEGIRSDINPVLANSAAR
jgi:hypothetical protein